MNEVNDSLKTTPEEQARIIRALEDELPIPLDTEEPAPADPPQQEEEIPEEELSVYVPDKKARSRKSAELDLPYQLKVTSLQRGVEKINIIKDRMSLGRWLSYRFSKMDHSAMFAVLQILANGPHQPKVSLHVPGPSAIKTAFEKAQDNGGDDDAS